MDTNPKQSFEAIEQFVAFLQDKLTAFLIAPYFFLCSAGKIILNQIAFRQCNLAFIHLYGVFETVINSIADKCVANAYFIYP